MYAIFRGYKITLKAIDRDIQIGKFEMHNTCLDTHCIFKFKVPADISIGFLEKLVAFFKGSKY